MATALATMISGCSSGEKPRIVDYLDELEFSAPTEFVRTLSLGRYDVPIPERPTNSVSDTTATETSNDQARNLAQESPYRLRLRFNLVVVTEPQFESEIEKKIEKRRGMISDAVITTCRNISPGELTDPRYAALKSRLTDELRPLLGENRIRQLVIDAPIIERL